MLRTILYIFSQEILERMVGYSRSRSIRKNIRPDMMVSISNCRASYNLRVINHIYCNAQLKKIDFGHIHFVTNLDLKLFKKLNIWLRRVIPKTIIKMVQTASLHRHACVRVGVWQCSPTV